MKACYTKMPRLRLFRTEPVSRYPCTHYLPPGEPGHHYADLADRFGAGILSPAEYERLTVCLIMAGTPDPVIRSLDSEYLRQKGGLQNDAR